MGDRREAGRRQEGGREGDGFGRAMTAAFTVGQRMEMYMNLPCNAFQTTLATYTGQNVGAGKVERVRLGARQTVAMSLLMTMCISALVWALAPKIVSLFGLGSEAADWGTSCVRTIALINIVLATYIPLFGVFQGTGHGIAATLVATFALTTRVIVTYALKDGATFGHTIVWWNGLFGFGMGFCITWGYYLSGRWKRGTGAQ